MAALQIAGAMLLIFHRTRLVGVFILLPVLANILLMDIFYQIGYSVVVHASIMMAGILYFLVMEFNRLKKIFLCGNQPITPASFFQICEIGYPPFHHLYSATIDSHTRQGRQISRPNRKVRGKTVKHKTAIAT